MMMMMVFGGNVCFCRVEDVTDPDTLRKQPKTDRSVCLYGYVRGCHYRNHTHVHIPGLSQFSWHADYHTKIGSFVFIIQWVLSVSNC